MAAGRFVRKQINDNTVSIEVTCSQQDDRPELLA